MRKIVAELFRLYFLKCSQVGRSRVPLLYALSTLLLWWGGNITSVHAQLCQGPRYGNVQTFPFTGGAQTYGADDQGLTLGQKATGTGGTGQPGVVGWVVASVGLIVNNGDALTLVLVAKFAMMVVSMAVLAENQRQSPGGGGGADVRLNGLTA
jgi:uncharacterized membrane protein